MGKITSILEKLSRTVAVPRAPSDTARAQKSWRGLKQGKWVRTRVRLHYRDVWVEADTLMLVSACTSRGVTLQPVGQPIESVEWTAQNWRDFFEPVGRPRKPKPPKQET